jgi:DNA-binding transcriptional regulator GbsR (MarR family)
MNNLISFVSRIFYPKTNRVIETQQYLIRELQGKYNSLLVDIKNLEEENIETTNLLYELINQIEAVDNRIDIITQECGKIENV